METQMWHLPAGSVWGGLRKETMASAGISTWERAAPPALAWMPENSVPPHMSLVPFKLLPQCWSSKQVSATMGMSAPKLEMFEPSFETSPSGGICKGFVVQTQW